jgi:hypothetical protein
MSKKHESMIDPSLFYCFVIICEPTSSFKFYIVPSQVVARYVKAEHEHWLREKRRERKTVKDLSGQVKSGQWWSGQNRPTDVARDVILLAHFLLVRQVRFRAPAPWPTFQDVTVV